MLLQHYRGTLAERRRYDNKQNDCSLIETVEVSHEEAAPVLPCRGRIVSQAWSHLVATCPGLITTGGPFGLLWAREGGSEPLGEEMGVRGSWVEFLLPNNQMGAKESFRETVISVRFIKRGCGEDLKGTEDRRWYESIQKEGSFTTLTFWYVHSSIMCCIWLCNQVTSPRAVKLSLAMCDSLDIDVGADDIFYLLWKWVLEGEGAGSHPNPFSWFGVEPEHHRQNLALQLHHLRTKVQHAKQPYLCRFTSK